MSRVFEENVATIPFFTCSPIGSCTLFFPCSCAFRRTFDWRYRFWAFFLLKIDWKRILHASMAWCRVSRPSQFRRATPISFLNQCHFFLAGMCLRQRFVEIFCFEAFLFLKSDQKFFFTILWDYANQWGIVSRFVSPPTSNSSHSIFRFRRKTKRILKAITCLNIAEKNRQIKKA